MSHFNLFVGSVFGGALDVADELKDELEKQGHSVTVHDQPELSDLTENTRDIAIFCTSTTGSGDFPGNISMFANALNDAGGDLTALRYGFIALGDSNYQTFCGAGRQLDEWLQEYGGQRIGERLEIDADETLHADEEALDWLETWLPQL